jgi:hypothetical protein
MCQTWLECIEKRPDFTQADMLAESTRTLFVNKSFPKELELLKCGFIDLGFKRLGLTAESLDEVLRAFNSTGVRVPGTKFKLRHTGPGDPNHSSVFSVIDHADGTEVELPKNWKQGLEKD